MTLLRPGDPGFDPFRHTFGPGGSPALVASCADVAGVADALRHAKAHGLRVAVRSGGHSVAGLSTNDGGLVIDLSPLDQVELLGDDLVRVGAGATWGAVSKALAPHGLAVSSGDTSNVGVGGLLTGGGLGWLLRRHGLTIDHLVAAEVVTADGAALRVSAADHPDLFWAVRGGAGTAAIVTRAELRAHRVTEVAFGQIGYAATDAERVFKGWREVHRAAGDGLTSAVARVPGATMVLACHADAGALDALTTLAEPTSVDVKVVPYPDILEAAAPPPGWQPHMRNRFLRELTDDHIRAMLAFADATPMAGVSVRGLGGAMNRVPAGATAFPHRDSEVMALAGLLGTPDQHPARLPAFDALWAALEPEVTGAYVGFLSELNQDDVAAIWPGATRERLIEVKRRYDPANVFSGTASGTL